MSETESSDCTSFNEGGADCPPKLARDAATELFGSSFNEGGADCPPKQLPSNWTALLESQLQ